MSFTGFLRLDKFLFIAKIFFTTFNQPESSKLVNKLVNELLLFTKPPLFY